MEIENLLPKGEKIMLKIKYKGRDYIKVSTSSSEYKYYEVFDNKLKLVEDKNLLEYFKNMYELQKNNVIYQ